MIIQGSRKEMAERGATILYEATLELLRKKQTVVIAVPGGRSVAEIYNHFRDCPLPWKRIHLFLLDERLVPADHPESNYNLVKEHMGSNVPPEMIHQFRFTNDKPAHSVIDYARQLENCGSRFDIVLASSGEDGHIASLFPSHHSTEQNKSAFFLLYDSPKPPPARMSASFELIRHADTGIVLFFGSDKKKALSSFFNEQLSFRECPAKIISQLPNHYLLTDQEIETNET